MSFVPCLTSSLVCLFTCLHDCIIWSLNCWTLSQSEAGPLNDWPISPVNRTYTIHGHSCRRTFLLNRERAVDYLNMLDRLYVFDGYAGWDPEVTASLAMSSIFTQPALSWLAILTVCMPDPDSNYIICMPDVSSQVLQIIL